MSWLVIVGIGLVLAVLNAEWNIKKLDKVIVELREEVGDLKSELHSLSITVDVNDKFIDKLREEYNLKF